MKLQPVSFLIGAEELQKRLYLEEVRRELFPNGPSGFNDDTFDLSERELSEILDVADTLPMLAERRLLVLRNADSFNEKEQELWFKYIENPAPHAVMLVMMDKLDKRMKLSKILEKKNATVAFSEPRKNELSTWVDRIAKLHQVTVAPKAREMLINLVGPDLTRLDQEIQKLALFVHPERVIPESAVPDLVVGSAGETIFTWTDQVVEGRYPDAVGTLHHLLRTGTPALVLVTMLARHCRLLMKAHHYMTEKRGHSELAPLLGVPPFTVSRYVDQAKKVPAKALKKSLRTLQRLDHDLKSTGLPPAYLLERSMREFLPAI